MFELFQYDFMVRAFIAGIIIGIIAPLIGMFLVVRRYSLMADTLSHVSLVGVAGGILFNINPVIGALITSVIAAFGMEELRESKKIFGESVLAIFLSGSLALAVILMGLANGLNVNFVSYLFGSITTVTSIDLFIISFLGIVILITIALLYKNLFLISYDEELAKSNGIPTKLYNIILVVLAAMTVSISMRIVGILLVGALMVIPVIAAIQFSKSFMKTYILSIIFSLVSTIIGLYVSFYLNVASGGAIVLAALFLFICSLLINKNSN